MAEKQTNEALEKLNRGIQESKQMVQQQTMKLAQEFFGDSVGELKQQIRESRATLESLPQQVPGGDEEAFQMLFGELMDNYAAIEEALDEAENNVSNLDTESLARQGEIDASEAARREARELGVDLTRVEGSGSKGRIIVSDVVEAAERQAQQKAEELGVDTSDVEGTGPGGLVTVKDVMALTEEAGGQAAQTAQDAAGEAAGQAQEAANGAVEGTQDAVGQAAGAAGQAAGQVAGQAGEAVGRVAGQAQEAADGAAEQAQDAAGQDGSRGGPKATNAAIRKAEEMGIDLSQIQGSGAGGLITIRDVVKA